MVKPAPAPQNGSMPGRILPAFGDERVLPTSPGSLSTGRFPINAHRSELFGPGAHSVRPRVNGPTRLSCICCCVQISQRRKPAGSLA